MKSVEPCLMFHWFCKQWRLAMVFVLILNPVFEKRVEQDLFHESKFVLVQKYPRAMKLYKLAVFEFSKLFKTKIKPLYFVIVLLFCSVFI